MAQQTQIPVPSKAALSAAETKFSAFLQGLPEDQRLALGYQMRQALAAAEGEVRGFALEENIELFAVWLFGIKGHGGGSSGDETGTNNTTEGGQ
jgi:hypothetical protein